MEYNNFHIIFNPFGRYIGIIHNGYLQFYQFTSECETMGSECPNDTEDSIWLDIHLNYDDCLSLEVQKRIGDEPITDETLAYWESNSNENSELITIVNSDSEYMELVTTKYGLTMSSLTMSDELHEL